MTGRSLLADALERAERVEASLERVLALAEVMDGHSSVYVRTAASTIRAVIAAPQKEDHS